MDLTAHNYPALAIVGMACRFPGGANDPASFWRFLINRQSGIKSIPENRWDKKRYYHPNGEALGKMVTTQAGFIDQLDEFDARFFGISPREAMRMDPQQRWLLEVAWEAIENAGAPPSSLRGEQLGVYIGISTFDYCHIQQSSLKEVDIHTTPGNSLSIAANRISYLFDLKGPSMAIDTACSSSLTALHLACHAIWTEQCTASLVGGVNAIITPDLLISGSKAGMLSPNGQCFTFDERADGYVRGEGAGMVLIKPLEQALNDGDRIYASVRATVSNQDGNTSAMIVPSVEGQAAMIKKAYQLANVNPNQIAYIEAHGTGTMMGDSIETQALGQAIGQQRDKPCPIGSVKTNIGHLEAGSGIAGLIKTALTLYHQTLPPNLNFQKPNANIDFVDLGLEVVTKPKPIPTSDHHFAGVSSFGFGGSNAHAVLEQAPRNNRLNKPSSIEWPYLLTISARDLDALRDYCLAYIKLLTHAEASLADICYNAATAKEHHEHRLAVSGNSAMAIIQNLQLWLADNDTSGCLYQKYSPPQTDQVVYIFSGQGSQWWAMGQELLQYSSLFRETVSAVDALLQPLTGWSVITEMKKSEANSKVLQTEYGQPAIFALQLGLAALWKNWGVLPAAVMGHSVGEVAAAYIAGIYTLQDAVKIIYYRSELQQIAAGKGFMAAVGLSPEAVQCFIQEHDKHVEIAAINHSELVTLAGTSSVLQAVLQEIEAEGYFVRRLQVDYAFHSHHMDPIKSELIKALSDIQPCHASIAFLSSATGEFMEGEDLDGSYWWQNIRQAVQFYKVNKLVEQGYLTYLEMGAHPSLSGSIYQALSHAGTKGWVFHSLKRYTGERQQLLNNLAGLHINCNTPIHWDKVYGQGRQRIDLPRYPWQREKYWVETEQSRLYRLGTDDHPMLGQRLPEPEPSWQQLLDLNVFSYLKDHCVWGNIILPAMAFVELGFALMATLKPGQPGRVINLELKKALFISPSNPPVLRTVWQAQSRTYLVYSSVDSFEWVLHAKAEIVFMPSPAIRDFDQQGLLAQLPNIKNHTEYYTEYLSAGYQFGKNFQLVRKVWSRPQECLAEIIIEPGLSTEISHYIFHPAMLDACAAAVRGSQNFHPGAALTHLLFLPTSIQSLSFPEALVTEKLYVHVLSNMEALESVNADISIYNDQGQAVAQIKNYRAERVEKQHKSAMDGCFYRLKWKPKNNIGHLTILPATADLIAAMKCEAMTISNAYKYTEYRKEFVPFLEELFCLNICEILSDMGWSAKVRQNVSLDELLVQLNISADNYEVFNLIFGFLVEWNILKASEADTFRVAKKVFAIKQKIDWSKVEQKFSDFSGEIELQKALNANLKTILTGESQFASSFDNEKAIPSVNQFHQKNSDLLVANELLKTAIRKILADMKEQQTLRVLEIGIGDGILMQGIVDLFKDSNAEYTFSGFGPEFVDQARNKYKNLDYVNVTSLSLNDLANTENLLDFNRFDLVMTSHALHSTDHLNTTLTNLGRLLSDKGILMFLAMTARRPSIECVFSLLPGSWFTLGRYYNPEKSYLRSEQWKPILKNSGFTDVQSFNCDESVEGQTLFLCKAKNPAVTATAKVFIPQAKKIAIAGTATINVELLRQCKNTEHYANIVDTNFTDYHSVDCIVFTQFLTLKQRHNNLGAADIKKSQQYLMQFHEFVQGLLQEEISKSISVYVITRASVPVLDNDALSGIAAATVGGYLRVLRNEASHIAWHQVDLPAQRSKADASYIINEIMQTTAEVDIAYRNKQRYVPRLTTTTLEELPARRWQYDHDTDNKHAFQLEIETPGVLSSLVLNKSFRLPPAEDEIEVQLEAGGINFRDVMKTLGVYPGSKIENVMLGSDFCGKVIRVGSSVKDYCIGDHVVGLSPYAFRSHVTLKQQSVFRKPAMMTSAEAAGLPMVFLTAHYGLVHLANIQKNEKVLIHAGSGGVGQAAIQIAVSRGCEIFSTAGSPEKRQLLKSLGVHYVLDSRSLSFVDEIMEITHGEGVDVLLNSLAGDLMLNSFSVLAPFGRFVEIGKVDFFNDTSISLRALKNNIRYFVIDMVQMFNVKPLELTQLSQEIASEFEKGHYHAVKTQCFPLSQVQDAFVLMAQGKHCGKVILDFDDESIELGACSQTGQKFSADVSYLIAGGNGGFGLEIAKWLALEGARHIVLLSRQGVRQPQAIADVQVMRNAGVSVYDYKVDITSIRKVQQCFSSIEQELPPLKAVFHTAMVLDDDFVQNLDHTRFTNVLNPKVLGAWHLHLATVHIALDWFVCFSSLSETVGIIKQTAYNAGNSFLKGLAYHRKAQGLPCLTIGWGAIKGAGVVERNSKTAEFLQRSGMKGLDVAQALEIIASLLRTDSEQIDAGYVDWQSLSRLLSEVSCRPVFEELMKKSVVAQSGSIRKKIVNAHPDERQKITEDFITEKLANVLGTTIEDIQRDIRLTDIGMDSLMAVELMARIESQLGIQASISSVLNAPSVEKISSSVLRNIMESEVCDG